MTADVFQAAMSEARRAWEAGPPVAKGPPALSGDFTVSPGQLGLSGEDETVDFYRFARAAALRTEGGAAAARSGPVVDFMRAVAGCLHAGGPVTVRAAMTWNEMQAVTRILRASADTAAVSDGPRHVRVAAIRLAEAWEKFSGTRPDPRSARERRLAWGDERGWI